MFYVGPINNYLDMAYDSMAEHVGLMLDLRAKGAITFDYSNNLRGKSIGRG